MNNITTGPYTAFKSAGSGWCIANNGGDIVAMWMRQEDAEWWAEQMNAILAAKAGE